MESFYLEKYRTLSVDQQAGRPYRKAEDPGKEALVGAMVPHRPMEHSFFQNPNHHRPCS